MSASITEEYTEYSHVTQYFVNRFLRKSGDDVVQELRGLASAQPSMTVGALIAELDRRYGS